MTAWRFRNLSVVIEILYFFRDQVGAGGSCTVEEILQAFRARDGDPRRYRYTGSYRAEINQLKRMTHILESLAELGLVAPDDSSEDSSGLRTWSIGDSWRPPEPPPGGGGDDGRVGPPDNDGNNDDDGGGLREALGHPVLFALPEDSFDELVNGLFSEAQS